MKVARALSGSALCLVAACADDVGALGLAGGPDAGAGAMDAGPADVGVPGDASVFDPRAVPQPGPILTLFAPDAPRPVMQGGLHTLIWSGRRYLLFWVENRGADGLALVSVAIDPERREASPAITLSPPSQTTAENPFGRAAVAVRGEEVFVAWGTEEAAWLTRLDPLGQPIAPATQVATARSYIQLQWLESPEGLRLLTRPAASGPRPMSWAPLDASGRVGPWREVEGVDPLGFIPAEDGRSYYQVSNDRTAGGPDVASLVRWSDDFVRGASTRLYEGDSAVVGGATWARPTLWASLWDYDRGRWLLDLLGPTDPLLIGPPGLNGSGVVAEPGGARLLLVHEQGRTADGNATTNLGVQAFDGRLGPEVSVLPEPVCVEDHAAAARADRVGVSWVKGCGERILRFTEVGAAQP